MSEQAVTLESLIGMRVLDAVGEAIGYEAGGRGDDSADARVFYARIDGAIYRFTEDTNDGYRSCLREVVIVDDAPIVPFPPMTVSVHWHPAPHEDDVIYFVNEATGLVVLEVGTRNFDDYYPSFVSHWVPEGHEPYWLRDAIAAADESEDEHGR